MAKSSDGAVAQATEHQASVDRHAAASRQAWGDTLSRRRIGFILASVMLGMLLSALDQTVVGTALPRIVIDLHGFEHYVWVTTGYLLATAASMPIWGKLSDAYGRKRFYALGMGIFVVGSALCGQAHGMTALIAFRALQGLGAGAMMPISQAIIGDIFPPAQRAKFMGILMSVFGLAMIVGPLLGGWITDNFSWRWVFYVNLPVGIVAIAFCLFALPGHVALRKHHLDYAGSALLVAAAVPMLLGFTWAGTTYPWLSWQVIGTWVFSAIAWTAFIFWELRAREPVINPRLFGNRVFTISSAASTLQSAAMFGAIMFVPLFVQVVQGHSATNSGTILMPMMLAAIVSSIGAGQVMARTGRYKALVVCGFVAVTLGAYLLSRMSMTASWRTLGLDTAIMGLGLGVAMSAFTSIVQNQYPIHRLGEVSASLQFFRIMGSTIGLAVFGTVLDNRFTSQLRVNLPAPVVKGLAAAKLDSVNALATSQAQSGIKAIVMKAAQAIGTPVDRLAVAVTHGLRLSLDQSINSLFVVSAVIGVVGLVVVLFLPEVPLRQTHSLSELDDVAELDDGSSGDVVPVEAE
ncbi:MAG TPA: MDR family MFS transporter [Thermoleophilia bacterium]|nr:MDR family MFS transporter [Thermoleophilia bacterium]